MSEYDRLIVEALGLVFIDVKMQDTVKYRQYRHILLTQYPRKVGMPFPAYLVCQLLAADFQILGALGGEYSPAVFKTQLEKILQA